MAMTPPPIPRRPAWNRPSGLVDYTLLSAIRRHVVRVLEYTEGDRAWAAGELGVDPSTLYRMERDWGRGDRQVRIRRTLRGLAEVEA